MSERNLEEPDDFQDDVVFSKFKSLNPIKMIGKKPVEEDFDVPDVGDMKQNPPEETASEPNG